MQQTQKYKLNLIESSDPFLPEGLNQNTRKIENALTAHEAAVEEVTDGLDQRVTVLEGHHFAYGSYFGIGSTKEIYLGFTPKLLIVDLISGSGASLAIVLQDLSTCGDRLLIVEGGFKATGNLNYTIDGANYLYLAFA